MLARIEHPYNLDHKSEGKFTGRLHLITPGVRRIWIMQTYVYELTGATDDP